MRPTITNLTPLSVVSAVALIAIASCGYFNSLYNARRSFDEARDAERRGDRGEAVVAYEAAIVNAASSYRGHADSRWGDDALLLIGRAHHALGNYEASRAAFLTLLRERPDGGLEAEAHAWLGASEAALGNPLVALQHLDPALATSLPDEADALARLWRGRVRFALGEPDPWSDLETAAASGTIFAPHASMTMAGNAIDAIDTARARLAFDRLFRDRTAARWSDSLATMIDSMNDVFGPAFTRSVIGTVEASDWPADVRESHLLRHALLAAEAGDTAAAIADAIELADRASPGGAAVARVAAARLRLATVDEVALLDEVRAMLLPVIANADARQLVRDLRVVELLVGRAGREDRPLALFAAAEMARDELRATMLARRLFITYADLAPGAVWAPKALIAAAALDAWSSGLTDIVARVREHPDNPYSQAVLAGDADPAAFEDAERQLADNLAMLRRDALRDATMGDVRVGSTGASIDTTAVRDTARTGRGRPGRHPYGKGTR